ncbi:MAG: hypothetical protein A2W99_07725 [Bacteroidetes bacterium GWF2_33_16]|nr:MAG: hypothetical protein A2X00_10780 [Bacteroidetes bacterium GWE2_32_14]OFY03664.1 MAG: hypothetical protein A2W99_07725 [Bacteroidetes bacterium GWF2_33_16]
MINSTLKIICITIVFAFHFNQSFGQENTTSRFLFSGQIITEGVRPVALAHIINVNSKTGMASDTLGYFKMWVSENDILNISAIGFEFIEYHVSLVHSDSLIEIYLNRRAYEIPEVSISYFGTYKDFEYKVLNFKIKDENIINELVLKELPRVENPKPYEPTLGSPISLLYDLLSHEGKSRRKYMALKEEEPLKLKIEAKYNREIVKNITGLEGQDLKEFMDTCNFSDSFILNTSEYSLYAEILKKFEGFKKTQKSSIVVE